MKWGSHRGKKWVYPFVPPKKICGKRGARSSDDGEALQENKYQVAWGAGVTLPIKKA